jgi:hypothetical protein
MFPEWAGDGILKQQKRLGAEAWPSERRFCGISVQDNERGSDLKRGGYGHGKMISLV